METEQLIAFGLLAFAAEVLGTVGGFGSSVFFVPIAGMFFDFHSVLGITAVFHVFSNVSKIALFRKGIDKQLLVSLGIPAVLFVTLGAWLSNQIDTHWLTIALAVFLVVISIVLYLYPGLRLKANTANAVTGGAISGMVAGLVGTGGAIRGITLSAFNLSKDAFVATSAFIDFGVDFSRTLVYWYNGYLHRHDIYVLPVLLVASVLGTYSGKLLLGYVSEERFKKIVLVVIFITGIFTLIKAMGWVFWF